MADRRERVILELVDKGFASGIAEDAAAVALLDKELDGLDGSHTEVAQSTQRTTKATKAYSLEAALADERTKRLRASLRDQAKALLDGADNWDVYGQSADRNTDTLERAGNEIDRFSGRLALMGKAAAAFGPALIPLGGVGVAGVAALASQLGFAAVGAATLVTAFQGVGDALEAVNKAAMDGSAENLIAAADAMERLDPAAQAFVSRFQELRPVFDDIRNSAQAGWFPGLTETLDDVAAMAPRIGDLFEAIGRAGGSLAEDAGGWFSGPEGREFIDFVAAEAPAAIEALGRSVGNLGAGMLDLWQAFSPVNADFNNWLQDATASFARWADGVSKTQGFEDFVAYLRDNGPRVAEAAGAIGNALVQITQAAAPLGGPVLENITRIAEALGALADSPLGTPILAAATAMSTASLAASALSKSLIAVGAGGTTAAAGVTTLQSSLGALALGAAAATVAGQGLSAAFDTWAGIDVSKGLDEEALERTIGHLQAMDSAMMEGGNAALEAASGFGMFFDTPFDKGAKDLEEVDAALAGLVASGHAEQAAAAMDAILTGVAQSGGDVGEAKERFTGYAAALKATGEAGANAAAGINDTTAASMRARAGLQAARKAAQDTANAFVNFGNSLSPKEFSLGKWLDGIERQTRALRNFRLNAIRAGENGVRDGLINHLKQLGPEGAVQLDRLANASESAVNRANRAFGSFQRETRAAEDSVRGAGDAIRDLPQATNLRIDVASNASAAAASTRGALAGIPDEQVWINVTRRITGSSLGPRNEAADGTTVPKTGMAYADRHPYLLADGEEVISNRFGQADRHRSLLKAINAGRLADGGTAQINAMGSKGPRWIPMGGGNPLPEALQRNEGEKLREWLKRLNKALEKSEKALDKERKQRDAVADKMKSLGADVQTGIRSELFGQESTPWGSEFAAGSPGAGAAALKGDIAEARQMAAAIKKLKSKGIQGPALAEILSQGGLAGAQAYAALSASELKDFARLFAQREQALRNVGSLAGNAAFGEQLAQENKELRQANRELKSINAAIRRGNKERKEEHKKDRDNSKRGSGNSSRNTNRGAPR